MPAKTDKRPEYEYPTGICPLCNYPLDDHSWKTLPPTCPAKSTFIPKSYDSDTNGGISADVGMDEWLESERFKKEDE